MEHGCPGTDHVVAVADNATPDAVATRRSFAAFAVAPQTVEYDVIEYVVAQVFGVSRDDLRAGSRGRAHVAQARQVAMYLAHVICQKTLSEVGRLFERDRTTVAHACSLVEDRRDDPLFDQVMELLEGLVGAMTAPRALTGASAAFYVN